jgi:hypothetical protein
MRPTNLAFVLIAKRAERQNDDVLEKTFVDFGSVSTVLSSIDHQVIFGRRGTGKTHLLTVHRRNQRTNGEIAIQLDMRNLGSAGGIYGDPNIPLPERATRLLIDILSDIHERLLDAATEEGSTVNLSALGPILNELFDAHREVRVVGTTTVEDAQKCRDVIRLDRKARYLGLTCQIGNVGRGAGFGYCEIHRFRQNYRIGSGNASPQLRQSRRGFPQACECAS